MTGQSRVGQVAFARTRLLRGATALLYCGPLLGGLAGYGWSAVPLFAAIFGLWVVIRSPDLVPDSRQRPHPAAWGPLASHLVLQVALITGFLTIGRGFGGVSGVVPGFVALLPMAVSFLALPLARMVFTTAPEPINAEAMVAVLSGEPADLPDLDLRAKLAAMAEVVPVATLRAALDRAAAEPGATPLLHRARATQAG